MERAAERFEQARASRLAAEQAGDATAWVRARALEEFWQGVRARADKIAGVDRSLPETSRKWNEPLHPRDRTGKFRKALQGLKKGESAKLGHVTVKKRGVVHYEVSGGAHPVRKVHSAKYAAHEAMNRERISEDAKKIAALKPGHRVVLGTTPVLRNKAGTHYIVFRNAAGEEKSDHLSALDAAKAVHRHELEKSGRPYATPGEQAKTTVKRSVTVAAGQSRAAADRQTEKIDKLNPPTAHGDLNALAAEHAQAGSPLSRSPFSAGGEEHHAGVGEHGGGHADPGVPHSAGEHVGAAQHGGLIHGVGEHAHEILAKAAPHVGTGKHREALRSANHVVQHLAGSHGDVIHTVSHFVQHLFSAHYDDAQAARVRAELDGNTTEWGRARALEEWARERLDESFLAPVKFDPHKHPRDRTGEFVDVLGQLSQGGRADLPHGTTVRRTRGGYRTSGPYVDKSDPRRGSHTPQAAAKFALKVDSERKTPAAPAPVGDMNAAIGNLIRSGAASNHRAELQLVPPGRDRMATSANFREGQSYKENLGKLYAGMGDKDLLSTFRGLSANPQMFSHQFDAIHKEFEKRGIDPRPKRRSEGKQGRPKGKADPGVGRETHKPFTSHRELLDKAGAADVGGRDYEARAALDSVIHADDRERPQAYKDELMDRLGRADVGGTDRMARGPDRLLDKAARAGIGQPDSVAPVSIGVTPYRGPTKPPEADVSGYYDTPRFRQFKSRVRTDAQGRGLKVTNFSQVTGLWDGNKEPAVSITVCCDTDKAHDMARDLGEHYNQDGVMTFTPDSLGSAFLYRSADKVDTAKALQAIKDHGILGGRIVDGRLEIIDTDGSDADSVFNLADELGADFHYDVGRATLLEKGTDYLAEGHAGEAEGAPEDEADVLDGAHAGHDDHVDRQATAVSG